MSDDFDPTREKVALVTGAQQGIGAAIARALAADGCLVWINYFDDEDAAEALAGAIGSSGGQAQLIQGDVCNTADINRMLAVMDAQGGIDILVNNAGIFPRVDLLDMREEDWDAVLDTNLKASFFCSQAAARQMIEHRRAGAIVNMTSGAAFRGSPRGVHYVSSKAGIVGLTRACAQELAPHHIRVNAVAPGITDTAQPRYGMSDEEMYAAGAASPLGRISEPEDIAAAVAFLCRDEARQVTGQTLHVNGGSYLY